MEAACGPGKGVINPLAFAFRIYKTVPTQVSQVPRYLWLGRFNHRHNVADAQLPAGEEIEDAEPGFIRKGFEKTTGCDLRHIRVGECRKWSREEASLKEIPQTF